VAPPHLQDSMPYCIQCKWTSWELQHKNEDKNRLNKILERCVVSLHLKLAEVFELKPAIKIIVQ